MTDANKISKEWDIRLFPIYIWFSFSLLLFILSMFFTHTYGSEIPISIGFHRGETSPFIPGINMLKENILMLVLGGFEGISLVITSLVLLYLQKNDLATKIWGIGIGFLFLNSLITLLYGLPGVGWVIYFFSCFGFLMTFLVFWYSKSMRKKRDKYYGSGRCINCGTENELTTFNYSKSFDVGRAYRFGSSRFRKIKTLEQGVPVCHSCFHNYRKWTGYLVIDVFFFGIGSLILVLGLVELGMRNILESGWFSYVISGGSILSIGVILYFYLHFWAINLNKYLKFDRKNNQLYIKPRGISNWIRINDFMNNSYSTSELKKKI